MAELDVLVLGDLNPDLVLSGDVRPAFGQREQLLDDARLVVGGSGGIMACGAARLGLRAGVCGVVGDDVFGRFVLEELGRAGVDTSGVRVAGDAPTGVSVILSDGADRAILTAAGSIDRLGADDVDPVLVRSARHVHVSSYFLQTRLQAGLPRLFEEARRAGVTTSVDPNWDAAGDWDAGLRAILPHTDVFLPNEAEARAIGGTDDAVAAARALAASAGVVAVKRGAAGAVAVRGAEVVEVPVAPADVVDAIGAGDAFDAGFVAGVLEGWPLERCLAFAVACGALSTRGIGGTVAQPTMAEALALAEATA
jgi:sugar/nucleoside kinase (ribokinase family)